MNVIGVGRNKKANAMQGFQSQAQQEGTRNARNDQIKEQESAQRKQTAGTLVGTGASLALMGAGPVGWAAFGAMALMSMGDLF